MVTEHTTVVQVMSNDNFRVGRLTIPRRVTHVEQELFTFPEQLSSFPL